MGDLGDGAGQASLVRLPERPVPVQVFHHDDGVVEDESDPGGDAAQGHQVEAHAHAAQRDAADQHGGGDDGGSDQRRTPVGNEEKDGGDGQHQSDGDAVADAADGIVD